MTAPQSPATRGTSASNVLEKLLTTLDVRLHAFAVCHVQDGWRLVFEPMDAVVIHYVLAGTGVLRVGADARVPFSPHSILIVPPRQSQSLGPASGNPQEAKASESAVLLADGLVRFKAGPGTGEILTVCGTISATYSGALGLFDDLPGPLAENVSAIERLRSTFEALFAELGVCQRGCPVPDQAASLILRSFVSRSGLRQTSPTGDQLRIWRDHRAGLAARASV